MPKIYHQMGKLLCLCHWHLCVGGYIQTSKALLPIEEALLRLKINALELAIPVTRMQTYEWLSEDLRNGSGMETWSESRHGVLVHDDKQT